VLTLVPAPAHAAVQPPTFENRVCVCDRGLIPWSPQAPALA